MKKQKFIMQSYLLGTHVQTDMYKIRYYTQSGEPWITTTNTDEFDRLLQWLNFESRFDDLMAEDNIVWLRQQIEEVRSVL